MPILDEVAREALAYEAPFLVEKLVKERIAESAAEGEALFTEVKRYMVLVRADRSMIWDMHSLRVDDAWHQFVLLHQAVHGLLPALLRALHPPQPEQRTGDGRRDARRADLSPQFSERYEQLFGLPLPDTWYDARNVTPARRVVSEMAGSLALRDRQGLTELVRRKATSSPR